MNGPAANRPRILIVEDERVVAMDLEGSLLSLGYDVVGTTESATEAIQLAGKLRPDLVLMDVQLDGSTDGIAAAEGIRSEWQVPVVFVTANTNEETLARAKATGPYGYLIKPFHVKELNATILVALHQHRLTRELFAEQTWLTTMLNSLSDCVIATDGEGCIRYLNPAAGTLTGWTRPEALGKAIEDVYPLTTLKGEPVKHCQLRKALASAAPIPNERFLVRTRKGLFVPVEDAAAPILQRGQAIGAVTVFRDITDRLRQEREQEEERDRLEEQVQLTSEALGQTRAELRALSGHLMTAQEEERRRLAHELHDDLAQRTAMMEMGAHQLEALLPAADAEAQGLLRELREQVSALSQGLREVSSRLYPSILADLGLSAALRSLIADFQQTGMNVSLRMQDVVMPVPLATATALYRITQEALRNAVKHAVGAPVRINLSEKDKELLLTIEDAGSGFNWTEAKARGGLGLLSMQERARLAGGTLLLRTAPGKGTLVSVRVPLSRK